MIASWNGSELQFSVSGNGKHALVLATYTQGRKLWVDIIRVGGSTIADWQAKQATRDAVRSEIHDFLWADTTDLPATHYTTEDVANRAAEVYVHVARMYGGRGARGSFQ